MESTHLSCQILMTLEFCRKIFEKYINNFMKILLVVAEILHADGWTGKRDRKEENNNNNRFSQFCGPA